MKKTSTIFLQIVIVLFGVIVLGLMLWEPNLEGVNAHATFFQIYFHDPFLAYVYIMSVPFFVGLYQAFRILGNVGKNKVFTGATLSALRTIKYCAVITACAIVAADVYLKIFIGIPGTDDPAGAIMLGMIATFLSIVVATAAGMFERIVQQGVTNNS